MATNPTIGLYVLAFPRSSETFIVTKAIGLIDAGFDVTIFTESPYGDWDKFALLRDRDDVRRRVVSGPKRRNKLATAISTARMIAEKTMRHPTALVGMVASAWRNRKTEPLPFWANVYRRLMFVGHKRDILHIEFDTQGLSAVGVKKLLGAKLLLSARGDHRRSSVSVEHLRRLFARADGYHTISRYLHDNLLHAGLSPSVRAWQIVPAIDLTLFNGERPPRSDAAAFTIVSVGRLAWAKGYEFAIDAIALLVERGLPIRYLIAGDGPYREPIERAARHYGLVQNGTVEFLGYVPRERIVDLYARADLMLHSALEEGFCNAVIEAQAMRLPVVTSDAGGLPENVEHGVTGLVVPRRDPRAMADAAAELLSDPARRAVMGDAGRTRALRLYDVRAQVEAFAKLYREL